MTRSLNVYALPRFVTPKHLAGGPVVVIDVLRASTTIVHALAAGASQVIPCLEVEEARARAAELERGQTILGGERQGLPIDGFDLGNSPGEYVPERVAGKTVVLTTTNGTRAMLLCRSATRVLVGSFLNAQRIVDAVAPSPTVHLLCAGTRGQFSRDDILLAGLLVDRLTRDAPDLYQLNAQALTAREDWVAAFPQSALQPPDPPQLADVLRTTLGGRNLMAIGLDQDILAAAQLDRLPVLPELDPQAWRIRLARR
ncbi:MAG TPA: 2-phosphosulfolactate phosphatase [Planctomycetaceae bacterium]|nr:2-phosphosulfolactate phosphatase [Planctomycetaceae bacterium]